MHFIEYRLFAKEGSKRAISDNASLNLVEVFECFYDDYQVYDLIKKLEQLKQHPDIYKIIYSPIKQENQPKRGYIVAPYDTAYTIFERQEKYKWVYGKQQFAGIEVVKDIVSKTSKELVKEYHSKFKGEFWECYDRAYIR